MPLLTAVDCSSSDQAYYRLVEAMEVIHEVCAGKGVILFRDTLYEILSSHDRVPELFWKEISNVNFEPYQNDDDATHVSANPNVADLDLGTKIDLEIKTLLTAIHKQGAEIDTAYVVDVARGFCNSEVLETVIMASVRKHDLLNVTGGEETKAYFQKFHPSLVQLKHHQFTYRLDGRDVSPFSAYNPHNLTAAKDLLVKAMDDYDGDYSHNNPPEALYTWDNVHRCYVCFHHSGNWEYHGYDLHSPYTEVPQYIKRKYHIEK